MIQAVEKAGVVDREKIRDALATTRFQSPVGDIDFDDHGYALMAGYPTQVQDGKIVAIGPEDQVPGRIQYPTPAWQ
jgi:ABC-type branched-subunit amino acid transport system substrate-binding protein